MTADLTERRAIEALRSGVPNRDAVRVLGSAQAEIEARFTELLEGMLDDFEAKRQTKGLLIGGDFGSGKSHLLEHLKHLALERNFVCSKVVISKETPLFDPDKLYRAAVDNAVLPDRRDAPLTAVASRLRFDSPGYAELFRWSHAASSGLDTRFPASLLLFERVRDEEFRGRIVAFWSGRQINTAELRNQLKAHGQAATYTLQRVKLGDLPPQRFSFTPRLMVAAGYAGWVLLFDEVELIARYTLRQRARSYAALARWAGKLETESYPGLAGVFTIVSDFDRVVLDQREDFERLPARLRSTTLPADEQLAGQAERGMRFIRRELVHLQRPSDATLDAAYERIRAIHGRAYSWEPPDVQRGERLGSTSMREYVRRWITEWDLKRLYPDESADVSVDRIQLDLSESPDLEQESEKRSDDDLPF